VPVEAIVAQAGYRHTEATMTGFARRLLEVGEEQWWIYAYTSMFESIRQNRWQATSNAVTELTGRRPASLGEVLTAG
jgi:NAD(P)H dehydrogenase (quinone)